VKRWLKGAAKSLRRAADEARLRLHRPERVFELWIISAAYNAEDDVERHLEAIHGQIYDRARFRHVFIDDASTDRTLERVTRFQSRRPEAPLEIQANRERRGGCENYTLGFRRAPPGSIVLQVDGDDWLPDPRVLAYLNMVYQDLDIWMTYNTYVFPDGGGSHNSEPVPESVIAANAYRDHPWISSHLHSFRRELFDHVREESLLDPETGSYFRASVDQAQFLPMLELAGRRAIHLERVMYVYNMRQGSIINTQRERQEAAARRIRSMPRYAPLDALSFALPPPAPQRSRRGL
jgi:glycosyltransferase involved in cell wall biosynthesis